MVGVIFTLLMLILLQAVLGFDNLLYISLESKKAPEADQKKVRKTGILIAIVLRIVLLFVLVSIIDFFQDPFSSMNPRMTVREIIAEGMRAQGMSSKAIQRRVNQVIEQVRADYHSVHA